MIGLRLNNYELVSLIGEGAMGMVYLAHHSYTGRRAAVKILRPELLHDRGIVTRFMEEARATNAIKHPNIIDIIDVGMLPETQMPYLLMEFLEGEPLSKRLERSRPLPVDEAVGIACQAASALEAAHAAHIVHRDLKPDNLFLVPDRLLPFQLRVKVLDFGIAKLLGDARARSAQTKSGAFMGTPIYMSPEQCKGFARDVDVRSDIYSLGVIVYELVCGQVPFISEGLGDILVRHITEPPVPPRKHNPALPIELERTILRALAKTPVERFESMAVFAEELQKCIGAELDTPAPVGDITAASSQRAAPIGARLMMVPPAASPAPSQLPDGQGSGQVPDNAGDISLISTMRVIADLAVTSDTGLVRFANASVVKDVYLVRGAPESVNSNLSEDRFGEYLVTRGFLRRSDLESALAEMGRFSGKLGEALVGLGFMRPLDIFRLLLQQVRERMMELFTWSEGEFSFFRGLQNPIAAFPLGLNSFEILGAGVLTLSYDFLAAHFFPMSEFHPRALPNPRINPEDFRLGPTPREVWNMLDGRQSLGEWCQRFSSPDDLLTFYRTLHLLVETRLVQFE